ncbi:lycopene cyclase domain-containing protein [Aeromicrobium camelliae]|uniref:Lycopene cyclase domain-containing protein n=1 Tax=Aeromicrobium camelliae TaxID=1538144 RepID=A0A3N6Z6C7_9ACTN|nr:lycopene cyclase domain-containing protein [Aeromicrobium camelliae]RQN02487.1 lycopene cyclase domain-containing protein [Aeromicrobium camelliae]
MSWLYLLSILGSTFCMGLVDRRWRLFLFDRPGRAVAIVAAGGLLFLIWDLVAIALGIYQRGESPAMTGIEVAPELPLEELFFIVFLCYLTMVLHRLFSMVIARREVRP